MAWQLGIRHAPGELIQFGYFNIYQVEVMSNQDFEMF
jgi:hypothetical protein